MSLIYVWFRKLYGISFFFFFFRLERKDKINARTTMKRIMSRRLSQPKKTKQKRFWLLCVNVRYLFFFLTVFSSCPGQKKKIMDFFSVEFWILEALRCCCSFFGNKKKLISCLCHQHSDDDDEFFSLMLLLLFVFIECFLFGGVRLVVVDGRYFLST